MFCEHCGTKLEENAQFCQNCGNKTAGVSTAPQKAKASEKTTHTTAPISVAEFYSEDWRRKKVFAIASLPYYDVMVDKKYLYLIQMPKYGGQTLGLILGLILLNILGAIIGSSMGSSSDTKKRKWYRSAWIKDGQLISNDYTHDIFLKVPVENLKGNLVLGKNKFTLTNGDQKIVFQKGQKEFERFHQTIKNYVL
jgi:hypothetical protein